MRTDTLVTRLPRQCDPGRCSSDHHLCAEDNHTAANDWYEQHETQVPQPPPNGCVPELKHCWDQKRKSGLESKGSSVTCEQVATYCTHPSFGATIQANCPCTCFDKGKTSMCQLFGNLPLEEHPCPSTCDYCPPSMGEGEQPSLRFLCNNKLLGHSHAFVVIRWAFVHVALVLLTSVVPWV